MKLLGSSRGCLFVVCSVLLLLSAGTARAQWTATVYNGKLAADKEVLVRLKSSDNGALARVQAAAPTEVIQRISSSLPIHRVKSQGRNISSLIQAFSAQPDVAYVEPNYIIRAGATTPNDPNYSLLWGLTTIGAPSAWDVSKGSATTVVGVVDTGVDYTHPDLAPNMWSAPSAFTVNLAGKSITCPAGSHGFNSVTMTCDPKDDRNHGTHVAGTIGAAGNNNLGVTGVNWTVKLMGLKFMDTAGNGTTSDAINVIDFALQAKAAFSASSTPVNLRILSNSWGGDGFSQALLDEINKANTNDVLFVVAAGNSGVDVQTTPEYPPSYATANMISVAATDNADKIAYFSNFGLPSIHLASPGVSVFSTAPNGDYVYMSGTSMATPHVSGAAALVLSVCPALSTAALKNVLLTSVDPLSNLTDKVLSGGRLNVDRAVRYCPTAVSLAPVSLFKTATPAQFFADTTAIELGLKFRADVGGTVSRLRFYKAAGDTSSHTGSLWTANGIRLATVLFPAVSAGGWQEAAFSAPVAINANTTYIVSYYTTKGYYADNSYFQGQGADSATVHALKDGLDGPNGVYRTGAGGGFPSTAGQAANYWVDLVFTPNSPPPAALSVFGGTPQSATVGNAFSSPLQVKVTDAASNAVPGVTVTFTAPTAGAGASFAGSNTMAVVTSLSGIATSPLPVANNTPGTYNVVASVPGVAPVSFALTNTGVPVGGGDKTIYTAAPTNASFYADGSSVELGVRFRSDVSGSIKGIRFYKNSSDTGPHTGSLWTSNGVLMATGTFTGETASGWQQLTFASPVSIAANTSYVASYHTNTGFHYTFFYFDNQGADNAPLHALRNGVDGPNGLYVYGSGTLFPNQTYVASNYWVDVVFAAATTASEPQTITAIAGTVQSATVGTSFGTALQARVTDGALNPVAGVVVTFSAPASGAGATLNGGTSTTAVTNSSGIATSPIPVANGTAGTYTVFASAAGLAPVVFSLTNTAADAGADKTLYSATPAAAFYPDATSIELGVRFRSDVSGYIKGIRFYKAAADTSAHTGSLWSSNGTLLATGRFVNETATGWQQLNFSTPIAITANTTYVASYHSSSGFHYTWYYFQNQGVDNPPLHALKSGVDGSNGLYAYGAATVFPNQSYVASNYWVDIVFTPSGSVPQPQLVTAVGGTPQSTAAGSTFGTALQAKVTDGSGNPLAGVVVTFTAPPTGASATFNGAVAATAATNSSGIATSPVPVANGTAGTYAVSATVSGLSPAVFALTNTATAADKMLFGAATVPTSFYPDPSGIELGVRFRSDVNGYVKGIRFYKGITDTSTHIGSLWSGNGVLLATGTFTNETATGWQQLTFSTPVLITANMTYVASYHTSSGFYFTQNYFANAGWDNAPLHALKNGVDGPNGVYIYGSGGQFPNLMYLSTNYWVDLLFSPQ